MPQARVVEQAPKTSSKSDRIPMRVSAGQKTLLRQAAALSHLSVSEFVLSKACEAAEQTLADQRRFVLEDRQWDAFVAALDAPPKTRPRLRRLLKEPGVLG